MLSVKSRPFCLSLNVLNKWVIISLGDHVQSTVLNLTPFIIMQKYNQQVIQGGWQV